MTEIKAHEIMKTEGIPDYTTQVTTYHSQRNQKKDLPLSHKQTQRNLDHFTTNRRHPKKNWI